MAGTAGKAVCPKCKDVLTTRIPRGFLVKTLLFFLPLRRYHCMRCDIKTFVWYTG